MTINFKTAGRKKLFRLRGVVLSLAILSLGSMSLSADIAPPKFPPLTLPPASVFTVDPDGPVHNGVINGTFGSWPRSTEVVIQIIYPDGDVSPEITVPNVPGGDGTWSIPIYPPGSTPVEGTHTIRIIEAIPDPSNPGLVAPGVIIEKTEYLVPGGWEGWF